MELLKWKNTKGAPVKGGTAENSKPRKLVFSAVFAFLTCSGCLYLTKPGMRRFVVGKMMMYRLQYMEETYLCSIDELALARDNNEKKKKKLGEGRE